MLLGLSLRDCTDPRFGKQSQLTYARLRTPEHQFRLLADDNYSRGRGTNMAACRYVNVGNTSKRNDVFQSVRKKASKANARPSCACAAHHFVHSPCLPDLKE